jgi:hypothetical protein
MSRRLLEACLLAYPRSCRERDRDHLLDLATDLAEAHGSARQAMSLLFGGLNERIELRRRTAGGVRGGWARRVAIACFVLMGLTVAAIELTGVSRGDVGSVQEFEEYTCVHAEVTPARRDGQQVARDSGCADTTRLVAAMERDGWSCTTHRLWTVGGSETTWDCTRR